MNTLFHLFSSEAWSNIIHALLHTLWTGALISIVLHLFLRHFINPAVRYRLCLGALFSVVGSGLIAWAILSAPPVHSPKAALPPLTINVPGGSNSAADTVDAARPSEGRGSLSNRGYFQWRPVLCICWITGTILMLMRSSWLVLKAEEVRKSTLPVRDPELLLLIDRLKQRVRFTRKLHVALTDSLTSPAVVGFFLPTLLLPIALVISLTPEQLEMIILHELAHIRRGDYFVNVLQLLIESMLYFNPAVWWISRQIRQEREACCDATAVEWIPNKAGYAHTLALVAERACGSLPQPAMSAVGGYEKSSLSDRIHRLLIPHYRPIMRPTWKALFGSLILATALLFLSAVGTRLTVIAATRLLTPTERVERIASTTQKVVGQLAPPSDEPFTNASVTLTDPSGNPVPRASGVYTISDYMKHTVQSTMANAEGVFKDILPPGNVMFAAWSTGFAPSWMGPLKVAELHETNGLKLVLRPGFKARFIVKDGATGEPIPGVRVKTSHRFPPSDPATTIAGEEHVSDQEGGVSLTNAAALPLVINMEKVGFATTTVNSKALAADETVTLAIERAKPFSGTVVDGITRKPVPNATLHVILEKGPSGVSSYNLTRLPSPIAQTDTEGHFTIDSFAHDTKFWIIVQSPGHTYEVLENVGAGQTNQYIRLRREVVVKGKISGDFKNSKDTQGSSMARIGQNFPIRFENAVYNLPFSMPVAIQEDGQFMFTNKLTESVHFYVAGQSFTQNFDALTNEWNIRLNSAPKLPVNQREVVFHFTHPSGVSPRGTVGILLRDRKPEEPFRKLLEIKEGEARLMVNVNQTISCETAETIGYWFPRQEGIQIEDLKTPLVVNIPVIPAGAIYAQTINADGSPAGGVFSRVMEVRSSPRMELAAGIEDGRPVWSSVGSNGAFVANALPLEGKYLIASKLGNYVQASDVISLSDLVPDSHVELKFKEGKAIPGKVVDEFGAPIKGAQFTLSWNITNRTQRSIGLETVASDSSGQFVFLKTNPDLRYYGIEVSYANYRVVHQAIDFERLPTVVQMTPGLKLYGQLLDKNSGRPFARKTLWASYSGSGANQYARSDESGNFEFSRLEPGVYRIQVEGFRSQPETNYVAGSTGKIVITPVEWLPSGK